MTHGGKDGELCANDKLYNIADVWEPFTHTPSLQGKPKIFLFQACRGGLQERRVTENDVGSYTHENKLIPKLLPHNKDFLFGFSTPDNHVAWRCPDEGSFYVQSFCEQASLTYGKFDIFSLLTKVTQATVTRGDEKSNQTPCYLSFLHEPVYLQRRPTPGRKRSTALAVATTSCENLNQSEKSQNLTAENPKKLMSDHMDTQTRYTWPNEGHALIFHTSEHDDEAHTLHQTLTNFKYHTVKFILHDQFVNDIEAQVAGMPEAGSLLVFVFAPLTGGDISSECCFTVNNKPHAVKSIWKHFFPSSCVALIERPKSFFFVDPQNWVVCDGIPGNMPQIATFSSEPRVITENADFLLAFGFGKTYCKELLNVISEGGDIVTSLTTVHKRVGQPKEENGKLSHFQSALRFPLSFNRHATVSGVNNGKRKIKEDSLNQDQPPNKRNKATPGTSKQESQTSGTSTDETTNGAKRLVRKVVVARNAATNIKPPAKKSAAQKKKVVANKSAAQKMVKTAKKTLTKKSAANNGKTTITVSPRKSKLSPAKTTKKSPSPKKTPLKKSPEKKKVPKTPKKEVEIKASPKRAAKKTVENGHMSQRTSPKKKPFSLSRSKIVEWGDLEIGTKYPLDTLEWSLSQYPSKNRKKTKTLRANFILDGVKKIIYFPPSYQPDKYDKVYIKNINSIRNPHVMVLTGFQPPDLNNFKEPIVVFEPVAK